MDRYRRLGGWLWVGIGLLLQGCGSLAGLAEPGSITWLLVGVISLLALLTWVRPTTRATWLLGWATAILLAADFAGAVADRFGLFGGPGSPGVSWGTWPEFVAYTGSLLPGSTGRLVTPAAICATAVEILLAALLVSGWQRRWVGKLTAGLFVVYLVSMAFSPARDDVLRFAMPVLVGGALLLSATSARRTAQAGGGGR